MELTVGTFRSRLELRGGTTKRWSGQIHRTRPRDPHLLRKRKQERPSDPHRVLSPWWSNHFDLRREWRQISRFHRHALTKFLEHSGAAWQQDRNVRIHADVNVTLHVVGKKCRGLAG